MGCDWRSDRSDPRNLRGGNGREAMTRHAAWLLAALVAVWTWSASSQSAADAGTTKGPGPVFSNTGPEADSYGAAAGYPPGPRPASSEPGDLVGNYSRFDQMVRTRKIEPAASPWQFKRTPEPAIIYRFDAEPFSLRDYLARNPATGLLIVKDDTILAEHYQYARTDRDRFLSQSMAKTITAMLIGIAIGEGKIKSIDDLAQSYVPGLAGSEYGRTSLRDLLQMSSGVAFSEDYSGHDDISRLSRALFGPVATDPVTAVAQFNTRAVPAGTKFHYASVETEVLGLVLRAAVGVPLTEYLRDRIWQPIGAESEASWAIDGTGHEVTYCCFNAVLRDYARLGRLLAHDGAWEGRQLIPRQWLHDATTVPADRPYLGPRAATPFFGYGYQTWILPGRQRMFALMGIRGQIIIVDPDTKMVLVQTAVRKIPAAPRSNAETIALWFGVVDRFGK
jgi:CubicO group peptidase (beta-lactamase class C family)